MKYYSQISHFRNYHSFIEVSMEIEPPEDKGKDES